MLINVIGDGSAGQRHARIMKSLGQKVVVLGPEHADPNQHPECKAVVIASPPETHELYIQHYLDRNVPILCEGPITIFDQCFLNQDAPLMTASNWRFMPDVMRAIDRSTQEKPLVGHFWFDYDFRLWRPGTDYTTTCYYESGIDYINMHEVDMCLAIMGQAMHTFVYKQHFGISKGVDALVIATDHFYNNVSTINSSWVGNTYTRGMRLIYENGDVIQHQYRSPTYDSQVNKSYVTTCATFLKWIMTGQRPLYAASLYDGYKAFQLVRGLIA